MCLCLDRASCKIQPDAHRQEYFVYFLKNWIVQVESRILRIRSPPGTRPDINTPATPSGGDSLARRTQCAAKGPYIILYRISMSTENHLLPIFLFSFPHRANILSAPLHNPRGLSLVVPVRGYTKHQ
jgi:hypothetical protein